MSRGYWIAVVALGLTLFLSSASQGQANDPESDTEQANETSGEQIAPPSLSVRVIETLSEQNPGNDIQQDSSDRQERDVRAQESMERAAWRMEFWARLQTLFVGIGTLLVAATLYLMIGANKAAIKAAEASEQSVQIARKGYQAQLRAYLSFKFTSIEKASLGNPGKFHFSIKNHGSTPAFIIRCIARYKLFNRGETPKIFFRNSPEETFGAQGVTFPGTEDKLSVQAELGHLAEKTIREGGSAHVAGVVVYKDAFGVTRRTIFHLVCDQADSAGRISFRPAGKHNDAS